MSRRAHPRGLRPALLAVGPHLVAVGLLAAASAAAAPSGAPVPAAAAPPELRLTFGGDVMFGREGSGTLRESGGPDPFAELRPVLAAADLALVNLETPLCDAPLVAASTPDPARTLQPVADAAAVLRAPRAPASAARPVAPRFRAPTAHAQRLAAAGIDVVSLANNHALDAGPDGLASTVRALAAAGIAVAGAAEPARGPAAAAGGAAPGAADPGSPYAPARLTVRGVRLAVLAVTDRYNVGTAATPGAAHLARLPTPALHRRLPALVRTLAEDGRTDVLIVSLHGGTEFAEHPSAAERRLAHALIDAGALVVVGHHPHVLQPAERRGRGLILYSLGNLVTDMRDARAAQTALVTVTLVPDATGHPAVRAVEARAFQFAGRERGPRPATPAEAAAVGRTLGLP